MPMVGAMRRMSLCCRARRACWSRSRGGRRGFSAHHCSPALASSSVALELGVREKPLKMAGGGGKSGGVAGGGRGRGVGGGGGGGSGGGGWVGALTVRGAGGWGGGVGGRGGLGSGGSGGGVGEGRGVGRSRRLSSDRPASGT